MSIYSQKYFVRWSVSPDTKGIYAKIILIFLDATIKHKSDSFFAKIHRINKHLFYKYFLSLFESQATIKYLCNVNKVSWSFKKIFFPSTLLLMINEHLLKNSFFPIKFWFTVLYLSFVDFFFKRFTSYGWCHPCFCILGTQIS